jgi:hypothetical protein
LPALPACQGFALDTPDEDVPPSTRIIGERRMSAPAQPAMIDRDELPGSDSAAVIRLPAAAETMRPKKRRSGSQKRQRGKGAVLVSLLPEERALAEQKAGDAGLSLSAYGRASMLGDAGPRARRRLSVDRAALAQAVAEFNRAGSNLNQIARALNEIAGAGREGEGSADLAELIEELRLPIRSLRDQFATPLAAILSALGHDQRP